MQGIHSAAARRCSASFNGSRGCGCLPFSDQGAARDARASVRLENVSARFAANLSGARWAEQPALGQRGSAGRASRHSNLLRPE